MQLRNVAGRWRNSFSQGNVFSPWHYIMQLMCHVCNSHPYSQRKVTFVTGTHAVEERYQACNQETMQSRKTVLQDKGSSQRKEVFRKIFRWGGDGTNQQRILNIIEWKGACDLSQKIPKCAQNTVMNAVCFFMLLCQLLPFLSWEWKYFLLCSFG
jgi:hypothetical protein